MSPYADKEQAEAWIQGSRFSAFTKKYKLSIQKQRIKKNTNSEPHDLVDNLQVTGIKQAV